MILLDFHSSLPDNLHQTVSTVDNHMKKLLKRLKHDNTLKAGGRVLESTDGCAKWFKRLTAIRVMSQFAFQDDTVIDRAIGCPGHDECGVDAVN